MQVHFEYDILVLLIGHIEQMRCDEVRMEAGTSKNLKIMQVKQVYAKHGARIVT